jgi:hypothetical protein
MPFWLSHYSKFFESCDLHVHSDDSIDNTEELCRAAGTEFYAIPRGTIAIGKNDRYIKCVITDLLERYECVLFAESPDDIITPDLSHGHDLNSYIKEFLSSSDTHRFLSGINIIQSRDESLYDPALGTLISQRKHAIRCPQYDNPFLWKTTPLWGRGWHDLGGNRLVGMGDVQGDEKRLYNMHIHYADFELANKRHHVRQQTYNKERQTAYASYVDDKLRDVMDEMLARPSYWFSGGHTFLIPDWAKSII